MNILILGASGFIGRNVLDYFSKYKENKIVATWKTRRIEDTENVFGLSADLTTETEVKMVFDFADKILDNKIDVVIQAAATTSGSKDALSKPWYHVTDNAVMNSLILREELNHNVSHHIFFSCTVMYSGLKGMATEDTKIDHIDDKYFGVGWTKVYLEKMCEFYSRFKKTKYTAIRHSNIYGPYDKFDLDHSHFFGATITKVMTAKDGGDIIVWGNGEDKRDFLYATDLVGFLNELIEKRFGITDKDYILFNLGSGENTTTNEVVRKVVEASGKELRILNDLSAPSISISFSVGNAVIKRYGFGWEPRITIEEGIEQTIQWWKENYNKK